MRGYFAIGIFHGKSEVNIGTLWRSAYQLGAAYIFTVGKRYKQQSSDTPKAWRHIPLFNYLDMDELLENIPHDCALVGIEMGGTPLQEYSHPQRAIYLLGAEDRGLSDMVIKKCHSLISLSAVQTESYNVSVAGSIVMYNRVYGG
jgi:tRNA G18 (ribose-2'-O)-methylase SpoU